MTSNAERAAMLERALRAGLARDWAGLREVLTDDVETWTPGRSTSSLDELIGALDRRDRSFSDIELAVTPLDVGGEYACVEWTATMRHSGALTRAEDRTIEPTGVEVVVHGATVAEFQRDLICSLRQYWDEAELLEQLVADDPT